MPTMMMMMMENGFSSSPRPTDSFPAGLRVLVVDDDPTWLKILERMLRKCSYEVTTCGLARDALRLLRERKDGFDIVISDVNMPDMDGFKLLEHVGLEMDLPVIMMSVDGETSRVMKGVQHGACDYLLKPIRMKELKNIWQHVLRKRMHDVKDIESSHDNIDDDDLHLFKYVSENSDCEQFLRGADQIFLKKRKDLDSKYGVKDSNDPSAKRPRVVWSVDLHQKFVKAVNQIGFDRVGPKKILDMMNVPWLTRENVASHLQKYRLYLSRLEKENEPKGGCGGGFKNSDQSPKDSGGGFAIQTPTVTQQSEVSVVSLRCPAQSIDTKTDDIGPKGINLWPFPDGNPFTSDVSSVYRAESSPKMGLDSSHGSLKPEISYDPPLASQSSWSGEVKHSPFEYEHKPHQQYVEMPFVNERHNLSSSKSSALNLDIFGLMANTSVDFSQQATQIGLSGFELGTRNHISGSESAFGALNDDFSFYLLPGDNFGTGSMSFDNTGFSEYNFPDLINGVPRFNFEYFGDSMEYAVLDQGLFIS